NEVIFPLLGDLRVDGPSLLVSGTPALPAAVPDGTTITMNLDGTKVLAKDGKTTFDGSALFKGGFTFKVAPFGASFTAMPTPPAGDPDAGPPPTDVAPDMTPVVATFTNLVDPDATKALITVSAMPKAGGASAAVDADISSGDGLNFKIVPKANWPASS